MTHLCIIGNSHTAALKLAWEDLSIKFPEIEITFFAARGRAIGRLMVHDGRIEADNEDLMTQIKLTSNGKTAIVPGEYDAFLVYGTISHALKTTNAENYSRSFARTATLDRARSSILYSHILKLRELTNQPVYAALAPIPSFENGKRPQMLLPQQTACELIQQTLLDPLSAKLIPQPMETLVNDSVTKEEFSKDSVRLEVIKKVAAQHPEGETVHMNKAYGDVWLRAFLTRLPSR